MKMPPASRFKHYVKVDPDTGCWIWQGACSGNYPAFNGGYAHIFAYEHKRGPVPETHRLIHTCGIYECVNPEHLLLIPKPMSYAASKLRSNK